MPDEPASPSKPKTDKSLSLVQREVALIVVLCVVAVVMFLATRELAGWHRATATRAAIAWYDKGQALLASGDTDGGVAALRKAVGADRGNLQFTLALVRALRGVNRDEEAWHILQGLREVEPEHAEINSRLARLAARRGQPDMAVRYYNHALYSTEPDAEPIDRPQVLAELAAVLLDQGDRASAADVLSMLAREAPADVESHLELARLYHRAGDHAGALSRYTAALDGEPDNREAVLGAAEAALATGDLVLARTHLRAAVAAGVASPDTADQLARVERAVEMDPLSERLTMTERVRRLVAGLEWAAGRAGACQPAEGDEAGRALGGELDAFRAQPRQDLRDTDVLADGLRLILEVEADVRARCGEPDATGEAWILIARARGAGR